MNTLAIKTEPFGDRATIQPEHLRNPLVMRILEVALETCPETTDSFMWVTCGDDSHTTGLHPLFRAFDLRTSNIVGGQSMIDMWCTIMRARLGRDYDVVVEGDHVHVEHDPKG